MFTCALFFWNEKSFPIQVWEQTKKQSEHYCKWERERGYKLVWEQHTVCFDYKKKRS
jgi:hypothetical protein